MLLRQWFRAVSIIAFVLALNACAQSQLAVHTFKQIIPGGDPGGGGHYKIGQPYQVNGVWYTPAEDPNYNETGIASWYGRPFHGQFTANGEIYDMNALTAAHKTLPMPTYVRVTNLENGRSLILKVNDRGPFVHGRIIDVSRRAAQLLGFSEKGTARTKGEAVLGPKSTIAIKQPNTLVPAEALRKPEARASNNVNAPLALLNRITAPEVTMVNVSDSELFVQAGAFNSYESANALRMELEPLGNVAITTVNVGERRFYRVRIGPLENVPRADATLSMVMARGHTEARIVVD